MTGSVLFFFIFIPVLAFILLGFSVLLSPHTPYSQKSASFECGFSSFRGQNRTEFSISFFIFGLIFLLLDLEILLVYPYAVSSYNNSSYGLFFVIVFILTLTAGFVFEISRGALKIESRQTGFLVDNTSSSNLNPLNKRYYSTLPQNHNSDHDIPIRVYSNFDLDKLNILNKKNGISGVDCWTNPFSAARAQRAMHRSRARRDAFKTMTISPISILVSRLLNNIKKPIKDGSPRSGATSSPLSGADLNNSIKNLTPIIRHFPASVREWNNSIYSYNLKSTISLPVINNMVFKLIKSYFNACFLSKFAALSGEAPLRFKKLSVFDKIYVSKPEIKHTNSKVIITLYKYELRGHIDRIKRKKKYILSKLFKYLKKQDLLNKISKCWKNKHLNNLLNQFESYVGNNKNNVSYLSDLISKFYDKKVAFRVIELRHFHLNTSILVEYLANKLTNRRRILRKYRNILKQIKLPFYNKYYHLYEINKETLRKSSLLNNISNVSIKNLKNNILYLFGRWKTAIFTYKNKLLNWIFTLFKYKALVGIRFVIAGRISRRNIASRSVFKVGYSGTLKNIDSSFKQLSVVILRGLVSPNLDKSCYCTKTIIGAFNVKGSSSYYYSTLAYPKQGRGLRPSI